MPDIANNLREIRNELPAHVRLIAVSKNHTVEAIREAYDAGQRIFGENRVQEMVSKQIVLPQDIEWHLIGHLQTNKVKFIVPFVSMIHSVDSMKLLGEISKEAVRFNKTIDCLLQVFIAIEETKFGLDRNEVIELLSSLKINPLKGIRLRGLMGMASFTDDQDQVRREFHCLNLLFREVKGRFFEGADYFNELSSGMSGDYRIAIGEGSTMVRIGTRIFGER
ncbi:MAG: YggS family pyridoxal phosphate-dependent enzyme [Bacteroidota bacterium]